MKRLIVCCDGTWNKPDQPHPTNVAKIRLMIPQLAAGDIEQRVHYDAGVGTGKWNKLVGGMFGVGLSDNVREAYAFLAKNYAPHDEIYLFGFSRGAFTVRSLAGFVRNAGLLKPEFAGKLHDAYDLYKRRDPESHPREKEATEFRARYSHEPRIKMIGVWDTVGALGIPFSGPFAVVNFPLRFHDTDLSSWVDYAYHALAIDERRRPFKPTLWSQDPKNKGKQVLEQVWFAGAHSNVGGGYPDSGLADIALCWMIGKAAGCGLQFDPDQVKALLPFRPDGAIVDSNKVYKFFFFGGHTRPLGEKKEGYESAADTAVTRFTNAALDYLPGNLRRYLDMAGTVMKIESAQIAPAPAPPAVTPVVPN